MINTKIMALWLALVMLMPSYAAAGHHDPRNVAEGCRDGGLRRLLLEIRTLRQLHTEDKTAVWEVAAVRVFIGTDAVIEEFSRKFRPCSQSSR